MIKDLFICLPVIGLVFMILFCMILKVLNYNDQYQIVFSKKRTALKLAVFILFLISVVFTFCSAGIIMYILFCY